MGIRAEPLDEQLPDLGHVAPRTLLEALKERHDRAISRLAAAHAAIGDGSRNV